MDFFDKTKGIISVFLIIILLPTMLFSVLLVDAARMVSARAMVQEASDLAAMSVLTSYDPDLKEAYGLFALKDSGSVESVFTDCLTRTLSAAGLDGKDYSEKVWNILANALGDGNPYRGKSFLNLYDFTLDGPSSVTPLYSLANPEVLQNQIVEYSKYRGLYVMGERMQFIKGLSAAEEKTKEIEKAASIMEEKMEIDEANSAIDRLLKGDESKSAEMEQKGLSYAIEELNWQIAADAMEGYQNIYFDGLTAAMEVLSCQQAGEKPEAALKKDSDAFHDDLRDDHWMLYRLIDKRAEDIYAYAQKTEKEIDGAISRLNDFIKKYEKEKSDSARQLVNDAETELKMYQDYYKKDIEELLHDKSLETLRNAKTANSVKDVTKKIWNSVKRFGDELEKNEEESLTYYFYFYQTDSYTSDPEEAVTRGQGTRKSYRWYYKQAVAPISGRQVMVIDPLKRYTESRGIAAEDEQTADHMETAAEKQSQNHENASDTNTVRERKTLDKGLYGSLPSKTFSAASEAQSYGHSVSGDVKLSKEEETSGHSGFYDKNNPGITASKNIFSAGLDFLKNIGEIARDDALTYAYILGTFKTRMTGNETFQKGKLPAEEEGKPYITEWRYLHEDGEWDMRFQPKSQNDTALSAEIEYLVYGWKSDEANENAVYATIMSERLANNMVALYLNKTVKSVCDTAAVAASALTGGTVPPQVFFWIFLTAWATAETLIEMDYLITKGYRIPLFKTSKNLLLQLDINGAGVIENYKNDPFIDVCYEDYLIILLAVKGREKCLMRTADLIEMNMRTENETFRMAQAFTFIRAESQVSIRYLFGNAAVFDEKYGELDLSGRLRFNNTIYQGY